MLASGGRKPPENACNDYECYSGGLRPPLAATVALFFLTCTGCSRSEPRVVLYCAQDEEFAQLVFADFQQRTRLTIAPHFDTEATKSVSIYQELLSEKDRPRCDVHWNNEILSTIRLRRAGLLEPYASPSAAPYPPSCRAPDGTWHAFAGRSRILLVNTKLVPEADRPKSLLDLVDPKWKGKIALAKPQFGTTATEAACLFQAWGQEQAQAFYCALRDNQAQVMAGNKPVAEAVGTGAVAIGMTDTDDAMDEVRKGRPVTIVFPDGDRKAGERRGTLFLPNTVAVIRGCPHPEGARKLVDYLLSPEVEQRLAESDSSQIPLNPQVKAKLPPEIKTPSQVKALDVDFEKAADLWDDVQTFLAKEFARP
jgi:iron(III) transport system substrate-binding protein